MKLLVAVVDYPDNNGKVSLMYVHTRNVFYKKSGIDVTVINFSAKRSYEYDGIKVITLKEYEEKKYRYDAILCHAANLKNHYRFLKKHEKEFNKIIFFYHGHEVLRCNKVYSKPYPYVRNSIFKFAIQDIYDSFKLKIWNKYLNKVKSKSYFIFVSKWMMDEFLKWTKINPSDLDNRYSITYNSVGEIFEKEEFNPKANKKYDFATVRNNLDGSKYSIDIVNRLASNTPDKSFVIVGKGKFFEHYEKAPNITWINSTMNHQQIIELLQESRFALMPTRTDAQGLMMCEMAAFGIPVITSELPVCHEVFDGFDNVYFIDNNDLNQNLNSFTSDKSVCKKHKLYYKDRTVSNEVKIIKEFIK